MSTATLTTATQERPPIALSTIDESPFNPRKEFEGIEDLGASIKATGLLQPLLLRPAKKIGRFEVVFGARRLRALRHIKASVVTNYEIRQLDDAEARALQLVENLQRENVTPWEEAKGFAALQDEDPKKWTPAAIAEKVGKTARFVQQRLAIARNLLPDLQQRLVKGQLSVEAARTLAGAPQSLQTRVKDSWGVREGDADQIVAELRRHAIPIDQAAFDPKEYKGEYFEHGTKRYFADVAEFAKLQNAAAQALVEKLRKGLWKTAKLVKGHQVSDYCWGDTLDRLWPSETKTKSVGKAKVGAEHLTAIVWLEHDHELHHASGVVPASVAGKAKLSGGGSSGIQRESAGQRRSRLDFNDRLHQAMTDKVDVGLRALLAEYLSGYGWLGTLNEDARNALHDQLLSPAAARLAKSHAFGPAHDAKVWAAIKAMPIAKVQRALAGYGARSHYRWDSHHGGKPSGLEKLIAAQLKIEPRVIEPASKAKTADKAKASTKKKA